MTSRAEGHSERKEPERNRPERRATGRPERIREHAARPSEGPESRWVLRERTPSQPPSPRREAAPLPRAYPESFRSPSASRTWWERGEWRRGAWQPRADLRDHRTPRWEAEHRTWTQHGGYHGYCIPRAQFQVWFGDRHWFRIPSRLVLHQGYARVWYRDHWFVILDPWPDVWGDNWYLADEVYLDYSLDGYYLYNRRHPGVALAVAISL